MATTKLTDTLATIRISGDSTKPFLQGQLTCDVEHLAPMQYQLAAICNPQGRVIALFHLILADHIYYLIMPSGLTAIVMRTLGKYAVFYKVLMEETINELPLLPSMPVIEMPRIYPETSGMFLPHELNLDKLGALSFTKGCYTGQEIIARMQHRGKLKNRLYVAEVSYPNPTPGSDLYADNIAGKIVSQSVIDPSKTLLVCDTEIAQSQSLFLTQDKQHPIRIQKQVD